MKASIAQALERPYARRELQVLQVAEEMPADQYSFRPTSDVRTFGQQLRHIGTVHWVVGAALLGEAPPVDVGDGDNGPLALTGKMEIVRYVKESFAYFRRAIQKLDNNNALEMVTHPYDPKNTKLSRLSLIAGYVCHGWGHYGQIVIYERMKGIVPPPSRPK